MRPGSLVLLASCLLLAGCGGDAGDAGTVRERHEPVPADAWRTPADRALRDQLRLSLRADPEVAEAAGTVGIVVAEGRVTLVGRVPGAHERAAIGVHARRIAGMDAVDNRLRRDDAEAAAPPR